MRQNVTPGFRQDDFGPERDDLENTTTQSERFEAPVREQSLRLSHDFRAGKG